MRTGRAAAVALAGAGAGVAGAGFAGRARWRAAAHADPGATRRTVAVATWRAPREGRIMTRLVVDAAPVEAYVANQRAQGHRLTVMHVVGAAAGRGLRAVPEMNARVLAGRAVRHGDVAVGFAVDVDGRDLAPVKIPRADELSPVEIAAQVWRGVEALRSGQDPGRRSSRIAAALPVALVRPLLAGSSLVLGGLSVPLLWQQGSPLGAALISNVAPLGMEEAFLAPVPFARSALYIALGTTSERPVVRGGQVVVARQFTLSVTGDHRLVDGVHCGRFFDVLLAALADPQALG